MSVIFFCARPVLQLLLAGDGSAGFLVAFKPYEAVAVVLCREAVVLAPLGSKMRLCRLPVTPMYSVRLRLAMM